MASGEVLLLGLGMQGIVALHDLVASDAVSGVTVVDTPERLGGQDRRPGRTGDPGALSVSPKVRFVPLDATDRQALARLMAASSVTVDLLPARLSFPVAQLAAELGTNVVNTNYVYDPAETDPVLVERRRRDVEALRSSARAKGITLLCEFGLDPGLDLVMGRQLVREFDEIEVFNSYGAGLPEADVAAGNPLGYKFSWSVEGVFRSYRRPARLIREGRVVTIPADEQFNPDNVHYIEVEELGGRLECFPNGDAVEFAESLGVRRPRVVGRYTARWPGHSAFWYTMAKSGFLDDRPLRVGDATVSPLGFVTALLGDQEQFRFSPGERDVVFLRVEAEGRRAGRPRHVVYQLIDKKDLTAGFSAMGRTVGFTVSIGAQMILDGTLGQKGLITPLDVPFEPLRAELEKRGVWIERRGDTT